MKRFDSSSGCGSRRFHLWPLISLFASALALANGSPIARSDLGATGNIRMIKRQDIQLQREALQITINGDWAVVRAEYHLLNPGPATSVAYGFPVDYVNAEWCNDCDDVSAVEKEAAGEHLRDVRIEADGKVLATRKVEEPKPAPSESPPEFLRAWIIADLPFGERQLSTVTVSYRVRNRLSDWSFTSNFAPSYSTRRFRYRLDPSGNWGDGNVARLDISVNVAELTQLGGKLNKIAPAGYTDADGSLRWQFIDVDLSSLADLEIEYDDSARLLSEFIAAQRLPQTFIAHANASSTLDQPAGSGRHATAMMLDSDLDTAWCEGATGDGAGQTITFEFTPGTAVGGIGIVNGYTKSPGVYLGNGRVRDLSVTAVMERRSAQLPSASLPDRRFEQLNRRAPASFVDWVADFGEANEVTRSVTLTIDAVTPGGKHPDTCISEIYFIGYSEQ